MAQAVSGWIRSRAINTWRIWWTKWHRGRAFCGFSLWVQFRYCFIFIFIIILFVLEQAYVVNKKLCTSAALWFNFSFLRKANSVTSSTCCLFFYSLFERMALFSRREWCVLVFNFLQREDLINLWGEGDSWSYKVVKWCLTMGICRICRIC
jgi:hypothetical protein